MSLYFQTYTNVLKRNFMLILMALVLLVLTFYLWIGVPIFIIGIFIVELTSNTAITHFSISLAGGLLFSMYFLPINLNVAKIIAEIKNRSVSNSFIRLEMIWILGGALFFYIFIILIQV
ncbi:hypothetical protein [Virgibacillus senegalensis]|uniref:hypothetical protein n=1 Tax=Virgibacillus senegalensis TaxID=1499679 RepID=UPI00069F0BE6|nr:hypothetical protein [Virgibacillus senegalensis]